MNHAKQMPDWKQIRSGKPVENARRENRPRHGAQKPDWWEVIPDDIQPADIRKLMFECVYLSLIRVRAGTLPDRENSAICHTLLTLFGRKCLIDEQNATGTPSVTEPFKQYVYTPFMPDGTPVKRYASKPIMPWAERDPGPTEG